MPRLRRKIYFPAERRRPCTMVKAQNINSPFTPSALEATAYGAIIPYE